jgi:hypothetical protein
MHIVQYLKLKGWSHDGSMLGENFILLQIMITLMLKCCAIYD